MWCSGSASTPWGKQRNANGSDVACGTISSSTTRGYTNQEEMPAQCLVNLNARIYDASIGKFMAADELAQVFRTFLNEVMMPQEVSDGQAAKVQQRVQAGSGSAS